MKNYAQIEELAKKRYGTDRFAWAKQRDGFCEGYKQAQSEQLMCNESLFTVDQIIDVINEHTVLDGENFRDYFDKK